jgi:hypothetical protein
MAPQPDCPERCGRLEIASALSVDGRRTPLNRLFHHDPSGAFRASLFSVLSLERPIRADEKISTEYKLDIRIRGADF